MIDILKKIALSLSAFIIMPISVLLVGHLTDYVFNFESSSVPPSVELTIAVFEGLLTPSLMLTIIFKATQRSPKAYKAIRICGIIGCVITIILVLIAIPFIQLNIGFRGVKM